MAQRDFRQMSLVDPFCTLRPQRGEHLEALSRSIDWKAIHELLNGIYASPEGADLIRTARFTSAYVHDSVEFKPLVCGDEDAAYADKAYASQEHRDFLAEQGIRGSVMHKAARGKPLKSWQTWYNKAVAPIRAGVERLFARMKTDHGFTRARYFNRKRNACGFFLLCAAMNIARMASLRAA